jgi:HK97 family phage portal protein
MSLISLNLEQPTGEVRSNSLENPATPLSAPAGWLFDALGSVATASGEAINEKTAMMNVTVFACVQCISRDMGALPLHVYERLDRGSKRAIDSDLYYLLTVAPNDEMTAKTFITAVQSQILLNGNGYIEIQRDGGGRPVALWPRVAHLTTPVRLPSGVLAFRTSDGCDPRIIAAENMIHIPGLATDGILGLSPIHAHRNAIGLSTAAEKSAARLFGNGVMASGMLTIPQMSEKEMINLRANLEKAQTGANQHRPMVIPADMKWVPMSMNPTDAQFMETRKYSDEQICRIWGVPPHKVGILERSTNNNIEHQGIEYVTSVLRPYAVSWEQAIAHKLLPTIGRSAGKYFVAFDFAEQLRGDSASTIAYYAGMRQWGAFSINDVLEREGQNRIGIEGDVHMVPLNMVNAKQLLQVADPNAGTTQPVDDPNGDQTDDTPASQAGDASDAANRTLINRFITAYSPLFRDALGRVSAREKRDYEALSKAFSPVLQVISDEAKRQASTAFKLRKDFDAGTERLIRDHLKGMEKRASSWSKETAEETATAEITKAVRALVFGMFREAGAAVLETE